MKFSENYAKNKKIGFGLVGTGVIAQYHIKAINSNKNAQLIGIFSNSVHRSKNLANRLGIKYYPTYSDMLKDEAINVVDIVTYSHLHAEYGISAIEHGKHVIVEKPIDTQIDRAEKLVNLAKEKQKKLSCVSEFRFSPGIIELRNLLNRNLMGRVFLVNVSIPLHRNNEYFSNSKWRAKKEFAGGGVLIMNAIHIIDVLTWLFGSIKKSYGKKRVIREGIEVEDCSCVLLEFNSGLLTVISATNALIKEKPIRIEIHGDEGSITMEDFIIVEKHTRKRINSLFLPLNKIKKIIRQKTLLKNCFYLQIKDMINAINNDWEPITNGKSGLELLKVIDKIYRSCK